MKSGLVSPALLVEGLSYAYGRKKALDGVSFAVEPGQCGILLGPNGAGKTTLFSLITRLYDSPEGRILIAGHDLRKESTRALARLGVVFQQPTLDLDLTVLQNLRYHAALHGLARRQGEARIQAELERQGMYERRAEKVRQLNGGHRRRVEIARALACEPRFMLLDEPFAGVDPISIIDIQKIITHLRRRGIGILITEHNVRETLGICDRAYILAGGQVIAQGNADEIVQNKEVRQVYLGEHFSL